MTQIIRRDSFTPLYKAKQFEIMGQDHDTVTINILEGERPMAKDNILLASLNLKCSPSTAEGRPQIEVSFAVDAGGSVKVSAVDVRSGRSNSTLITAAHTRFTCLDIEQHLMTASLNADVDNKFRARLAASPEEKGDKDGRSKLISIPEDQTSNDDENIIDESQWELKTWLASMISSVNQAARRYLSWLGDREELPEQEAEQDEL